MEAAFKYIYYTLQVALGVNNYSKSAAVFTPSNMSKTQCCAWKITQNITELPNYECLTLEMGRWKTHTKWFWDQISVRS